MKLRIPKIGSTYRVIEWAPGSKYQVGDLVRVTGVTMANVAIVTGVKGECQLPITCLQSDTSLDFDGHVLGEVTASLF